MNVILTLSLIASTCISFSFCDSETCDRGTFAVKRYLLYRVNSGEGFNLRRDVYMRMSSLVKSLNTDQHWVLVLPPFANLYHWRQTRKPVAWREFFDIESLTKYVPVMDFDEFLEQHGSLVDEVYYLQHYEDTFSGGEWEEKISEKDCLEEPPYRYDESTDAYRGYFWGYDDVKAKEVKCISVQGYSKTLVPLIANSGHSCVMVDRAETVLHDEFGSLDYWSNRRSMRFSKNLVRQADVFRKAHLNSTNESDGIIIAKDWRDTKKTFKRSSKGGPYLSVHLRRRDFLQARKKQTPGLPNAAKQIASLASSIGVDTVFIATDAPNHEVEELVDLLKDLKVVRFTSSRLIEGEVAIVDQLVAAHAQYFIGSHESTFSFRIQEEREIMGFPTETTFNRLCGDKEKKKCSKPSKWTIVI